MNLLHIASPIDFNYENTLKHSHKENTLVHGRMKEEMNGARSSSRGKTMESQHTSLPARPDLRHDHGQIRKKGVPNVCLQFPYKSWKQQ